MHKLIGTAGGHRSRVALAVLTLLPALTFVVSSTPANAGGPLAGATYVALGDSYAAGEGLGLYDTGTDDAKGTHRNMCHRSARAYARSSTVLPTVTSRAFWACSGATSPQMMTTPPQTGTGAVQWGQPKQTATLGSSTKYVTVSAGGNDVNFGDIGLNCIQAVTNHNSWWKPGSRSCPDQLRASEALLASTRTNLAKLYRQILDTAAYDARVVVVGYPRIFPTTYPKLSVFSKVPFCILNHYPVAAFQTIDVGLPQAHAQAVDAFIRSLNHTVVAAMTDAVESSPWDVKRLVYADTYATSVPRNCLGTTRGATVNGLNLTLAGMSGPTWKDKIKLAVSEASLHPTQDGQRMFARVAQSQFTTAAPRTARAVLAAAAGCATGCLTSNTHRLKHPAWGDTTLLTLQPQPAPSARAAVALLDRSGTVRWRLRLPAAGFYLNDLVWPATDKSGNVFVRYNPGRYNGIIVLRPTVTGMTDLGTAPKADGYAGTYYFGGTIDLDRDGKREIVSFDNDCDPTCAGGTTTSIVHVWNGRTYVPVPGAAPVSYSCVDTDTAATATCLFIRDVQSGDRSRLDAAETEASQGPALPRGQFSVGECELEGDITVVCPVEFADRTLQFALQPANATYDPVTGGVDLDPGQTWVRYHVIGYQPA